MKYISLMVVRVKDFEKNNGSDTTFFLFYLLIIYSCDERYNLSIIELPFLVFNFS